jgi:hypothetical protein
MYLTPSITPLADKDEFCKLQALKYKYADDKSAPYTPQEKLAMLPLQLTRYLFKRKIGTLPYDVEDMTGDRQKYYRSLDLEGKKLNIDKDFVALMSGSKFKTFGRDSPKKIQFF